MIESCLERVRALARDKVLRGHHAEVAPAALGIGLEALVAVRLTKHSRDAFRALYSHMLSLPEVLSVFHVSGVNDLQVHVAVRDIGHLRDVIVEQFATRTEVDHCETAVLFGIHRTHRMPCYVEPADRRPAPRRRRAKRRRS